MARIFHEHLRVDAGALLSLCREVLAAHGIGSADAGIVARHLVETNLRGTDSHGVARLPHYIRRLRAGSINAQPQMRFERRGPAVGLLDGDHGLGHLVKWRAVEECARLADDAGAGWVAVRNSSHCGALAPLGLALAQRGMIGIVFSHVDPMVLPHGARAAFCGTNPICLTAPGSNGRTLCLDMATSVVPWNLIANAAAEGIAIPPGWAVDNAGCDTTNPRNVEALYPFGNHKGSGLGILIDVLCAMLSGAPYGPDIPRMYGDLANRRRLGGLVGAIRISALVEPAAFQERVTEMIARLCGLPPAEGVDRVRFPGQPELETKAERERHGIPIGPRTFAELNQLAASLGVPLLQANSREPAVHAET